jgi:hypothetical protein
MSLLCSWSKNKPITKPVSVRGRQISIYLSYSLTEDGSDMILRNACWLSENYIEYIQEDKTLHNHLSENPKSYSFRAIQKYEGNTWADNIWCRKTVSLCLLLIYNSLKPATVAQSVQWRAMSWTTDGSGFESLHIVQTSYRAYPASNSMDTGVSFPGVKPAGAWPWQLTFNWYRGH